MKPLLVSSGEPAGIGPDVCLALADFEWPLVIIGDLDVLKNRAKQLHRSIQFLDYQPEQPLVFKKGQLHILHCPCPEQVIPGQLNQNNAIYVLEMLTQAVKRCLDKEFSALVTAPVNKAIINQVGYPFSGHTEFLAAHCHAETVVMMLACDVLKVALVTTHLPLKTVPEHINKGLIIEVIEILHRSLIKDFKIDHPKICVAGLNPHAGEGGYLGREEIEIIEPALKILREKKLDIEGPLPADTMFSERHRCDAYVAMYHDQGLPVLKYAGFGQSVNITLGLPILRTSVDHGTALDLAGTGRAEAGSLVAAVEMAYTMAMNRTLK